MSTKPVQTLGSGLPIEERLRQAEIENARLRKIARQMFSCISLRDMYTGNIDGDLIDVYNAWISEFGDETRPPYDGPPPSADAMRTAQAADEADESEE